MNLEMLIIAIGLTLTSVTGIIGLIFVGYQGLTSVGILKSKEKKE